MRVIPPETRDELDKLERKNAENPEGRYFVPLANALRKAGDLAKATTLLEAGLGRHPDYVSAHIVLGRCLQDGGDMEAAESRFQRVLSLDPQNLVALRTLGDIAAASHRTGVARDWYGQLLEVDPMNEEARLALADLDLNAGPPPLSDTWDPVTDDDDDVESPPPRFGWTAPSDEPPAEETPAEEIGEDQPGDDQPGDGPLAGIEGEVESEFGSGEEPEGQVDQESRVAEDMRENTMTGGDVYDPDEPFGDEGPVITETIAELYTRQGFYERAVVVYRELIRRRGSDPGLEARLARVERLSRGEADPVDDPENLPAGGAGLTVESEDAAAPESRETEARDSSESHETEHQETGSREADEPAAVIDAHATDTETDEGAKSASYGYGDPFDAGFDRDPFADSFAAGFPSADLDDESSDPPMAVPASDDAADRPVLTIGDYLRGVLTWAPSSRGAPGGALPEPSGSGAAGSIGDEPDASSAPEADFATPVDVGEDDHDFVEAYVWANRPSAVVDPSISHRLADDGASELAWEEPILEEATGSAVESIFGSLPLEDEAEYEQELERTQNVEGEVSSLDASEKPVEAELPPSSPPDDDLFPWELPPTSRTTSVAPDVPRVDAEDQGESGELAETAEAAGAPGEIDTAARADTEADTLAEAGAVDEDAGPWGSAPDASSESTSRTPDDYSAAGDEDDDDLESFQAWLRSLKR